MCSSHLHDRVDAGGEWFDMPDDYNTEFPIFQSSGAGPTVGGRLYRPFALVEDNDDLDDWPDELEHNDPFDPYFDSQGLGHGVFPGLDLDGDGILDFAATGSGSPFLQYHVEAPDLSFGDDFNNNGMPDLRENDNLADYMYPLDHRGFHAFLRYNPTSHAQLRLGAYRMEQPTLGLDSDAGYIEGQYQRDWQDLGYVRANHRIKWVQDGIPNTVFNFGSQSSLQQDPLEDRDAIENLAAAGSAREPRRNRQSDLCRVGPVDRARDEHPHYRHLQACRSERQNCGRSPAGIAGDHHTLCHGQQDRLHL